MDYEKAYKEALERAKKVNECEANDREPGTSLCEYIFPELAESEDERIRKEFCKDIWTFIPNEKAHKYIAWLEKQGEKETTHAIEPKYKVGDWLQYRNAKPFFVEQITKQGYVNGNSCLPFNWESEIHLWTIKDAKDGDVLVNGSNIFIFHFIYDTRLMGYCHINTDDGRFYDDLGRNECFCLIDGVVMPATKEQRELLFQEMKEAGYKWDAEKKELAVSEDERIRKDIIRIFKGEISYTSKEENEKYIAWLEKQSEKGGKE